MKTAVDTDGLPSPGDVVLLRSDPMFFVVLSYHPDAGWKLRRLVRSQELGRYRRRHPGPSEPIAQWAEANLYQPSHAVNDTKLVSPTEAGDFLDVPGSLAPADWAAVQRMGR